MIRRIDLIAREDPNRAEQLALECLTRRPRPAPEDRVRLYQRLSHRREVLQTLIEDVESLFETAGEFPRYGQELLVALARRAEPEAAEAAIRLFGRGDAGVWYKATEYFSEEIQNHLRASIESALRTGDTDGSWSMGDWGSLLGMCGPSEDNVKLAIAVYDAVARSGWDGIRDDYFARFVHTFADEAVIAQLLRQLSAKTKRPPSYIRSSLLMAAAERLAPEQFYEIVTHIEGWEEELLDDILTNRWLETRGLSKGEQRFDPRWMNVGKDKKRPLLVFWLSEPGDVEAEAYFLENPKHQRSDPWPRPKEALRFEIIEDEGYMIGRAGDGWATFISRGAGESLFGLSLSVPVQEGSALGYSVRGDGRVESCTATLIGADGAELRRSSTSALDVSRHWSSPARLRLPAGLLVRLDFQLYAEDAAYRGFVQLRSLSVKPKRRQRGPRSA